MMICKFREIFNGNIQHRTQNLNSRYPRAGDPSLYSFCTVYFIQIIIHAQIICITKELLTLTSDNNYSKAMIQHLTRYSLSATTSHANSQRVNQYFPLIPLYDEQGIRVQKLFFIQKSTSLSFESKTPKQPPRNFKIPAPLSNCVLKNPVIF